MLVNYQTKLEKVIEMATATTEVGFEELKIEYINCLDKKGGYVRADVTSFARSKL